ncbi:AAA family ATPase [Methermicoccus shengliensis]|uniref:AAA family ATPase n=1 Tax=Methermicoccus shengliensis TaxID=660064 RepID=A0A832VZ63_9EURY|nr:carbon monoxide dehydrogenase accessory protein CooC [Methermicoccus shengliensis]KUK05185.1 MAG: CODH nickel-insertion accessory protein [Euryarchaeota archaeon 55_53]KUK30804.1 MAG: CODH nickel-insertion accessory protein [Methanosarcinales archeaon 56_1174]MDI3487345.1 dehydrogenase maturation factor [Methanosarcinales archaeon]MDN5294581.1 dehydrogenase maturation factor [Methanosarcinales archaeon]HIH69289.1 AAA family ATPase [Methermicoccus shengliensis]
MKIAITGKGGVGKTTLAGTLARLMARDGFDVVAIDADPDMNLGSAIGCEPPEPLISHRELIEERASMGDGVFVYNPKVDDVLDRFSVLCPEGVRLLVMGTVDKGGSGCMCPETAFLKAFLRHVLLREKSVLIMDMEAGIEHLGRGTAKGFDLMLIVVENGMRSVQTAERIKSLSSDIGIKRLAAVLNKANGDTSRVEQNIQMLGIPLLGSIPLDENVARADREGIPPIELGGSAIEAICNIKNRILEMLPSQH